MIPVDKLRQRFLTSANNLAHLGASTWQRFDDWADNPAIARDALRGGGLGNGKNDDRLEDERLDRQAAAYQHELDTLTRRLEADHHRLDTLLRIANPDRPSSLRPGELTNAQLIADGWCPSCFRHDKHLAPIAEGRYRDRCRPCGEHRASTGGDPSLEDLRIMHSRGKRVRQRIA